MKKLLLLIFILLFLFLGANPNVKPVKGISGTTFLKTTWGGTKLFNKFNPENHSPGCHSTSLAQLAFHHGLKPYGDVEYLSSKGYKIKESFNKKQFDLSLIAKTLLKKPSKIEIKSTAFYVYAISVILRKDFGTGDYMPTPDFHKTQVEAHLDCIFIPHIFKPHGSADSFTGTNVRFFRIISGEINAGRPLGMYYTNFKGSGHAVVVDGITTKKGIRYIHANYGWGGKNDGWFPIGKCVPDDSKLLLLITLKPKPGPTS